MTTGYRRTQPEVLDLARDLWCHWVHPRCHAGVSCPPMQFLGRCAVSVPSIKDALRRTQGGGECGGHTRARAHTQRERERVHLWCHWVHPLCPSSPGPSSRNGGNLRLLCVRDAAEQVAAWVQSFWQRFSGGSLPNVNDSQGKGVLRPVI